MFRRSSLSIYWMILMLALVLATVPQGAAGQVVGGILIMGTPSPAPSPTPVILPFAPPELPRNRSVTPKIIFIIGQGDPATAGKLISSLAEQLQPHYYLYFGNDNWLVPEPTWTLGNFLDQCAADPAHTQGAFVVGLDSTASVTTDHFSVEPPSLMLQHIFFTPSAI
jgi:hypothetical protein